jgi:very-short-patch-repair endonuclease
VGEIAGRQHGVVAVRQLLAAGFDYASVTYRERAGRLHRVHRGVYAVGHTRLSPQGRWMAGVLAVSGGPSNAAGKVLEVWRAAVSHRSAAELWELLPARDGPVDITVRGYGGRMPRAGIRLHRSATLEARHVTLRDRIPVTAPARTIADLRRTVGARRGALVSPRGLRRAIRQAEVLGLPIGEEATGDRTRSDLERDFLRLCRRHRLPTPDVNVRVGRDLVDFLWDDCRLVVETDGYLYHRGRTAAEDDRERDLRLRLMGFDVIRLAEKQIDEEAELVAEILRAELASARRRVGPGCDEREDRA